jgi:tetratricopeptide (TPR) repeat protein
MRAFTLLLLLCLSSDVLAASAADLIASGKAAFLRRDYDGAVQFFEKAVEADPKSAEAHYRLASTLGRQAMTAGVLRQATLARRTRAALETARQLDPSHLDTRAALIDYYSMAPGFMGGGMDKAMAEAAELKKMDAFRGRRAYANIYLRQKKQDLARKELVELVRENPRSPKAHQILGNFLLTEKNYQGALHEFEMALQLDPTYMPPHLRIGQHAALTGTGFARAEAGLKKYLAYQPAEDEAPLSTAWYWLGMLYEKQGRKAEAKQSFANGLKLAPDDKTLKEALKRVS